MARPPLGQLPPEQKALHAAGKGVRPLSQPTQEGPGSKAPLPAAAAAAASAPSAAAQPGSKPAASAAPAAAGAQPGATGQRPLLVPRDPRLRAPAAPAVAATPQQQMEEAVEWLRQITQQHEQQRQGLAKLQGTTQQQGEPAASSGPYSPTQPSRERQRQDIGQAASPRAAGQEAAPLGHVYSPTCPLYSPTTSPVHSPVPSPKPPTGAGSAALRPGRAAARGEGKEVPGKKVAVVAAGVKQELSGAAAAAVKEEPSSAAAAACSSCVSNW